MDNKILEAFTVLNEILPIENIEGALARIEELKTDNSLYKVFFENMSEAVGIISTGGTILFTNKRIPEILGYSESEIKNKNIFDLIDKKNSLIILNQLIKQLTKNDWSSYELCWNSKEGIQIPTSVSPKPFYNLQNEFIGSFALVTEVTHLKTVEMKLNEALGKVGNLLEDQRSLNEKLKATLEENKRLTILNSIPGVFTERYIRDKLEEDYDYDKDTNKAKTGLAIMIIDIEQMINKHSGHRDYILTETAKNINNLLRKQNKLGRWENNNFIVVCPRIKLESEASYATGLKNILVTILKKSTLTIDGINIAMDFKIGVATKPGTKNLTELVKKAIDDLK